MCACTSDQINDLLQNEAMLFSWQENPLTLAELAAPVIIYEIINRHMCMYNSELTETLVGSLVME